MNSAPTKKEAESSGGASTSMNRWCSELLKSSKVMNEYARCLLKEEGEKSVRLAKALAAAGLQPHPQYTFSLPSESAQLLKTCRRIEMEGWLITVRVVGVETGAVLYRLLDSDSRTVEAGLLRLRQDETMLATVTPNRHPTVSGTLLACDGDAVMEMVYGPHHWLTKATPSGIELERCWFTFPHLSIKYSTLERSHREMLYRHLRRVIHIGLGMRLRDFAETRSSFYAEFQWDARSGYKFFELSYAWVWTGSSGSIRASNSDS